MNPHEPESNMPLSNEDFEPSRFEPHGAVTVLSEGNIVRYDVTGPFNAEFMVLVVKLVDKLYSEVVNKGPFGEVTVFRNSMLMPPDAISRIIDVLQRWKIRGCAPLATAWVIEPNVDGALLMVPLFEKKFSAAGHPFLRCDNVEEAEIWLKKILLSMKPQNTNNAGPSQTI